MVIEFPLQLVLESDLMDKEAIKEEAENYVHEGFKIQDVQLVNVTNIYNPAGPDFVFRANIFYEDIFELINYIAGEPIFNNLSSISGPKMQLNLARRFVSDFNLKNYFHEHYGEILNEYNIKIIS